MIDPNLVCPLTERLDFAEVEAMLEDRLARIIQASEEARLAHVAVLDADKRELRLLVRLGRALHSIATERFGIGGAPAVSKFMALEHRVRELTGP